MNKKIRFTLCLLILVVLGCSKQKERDDLNRLTIISGIVQNMDVYPTTKDLTVEVKDFRDRKSLFKGAIKEDGTFRMAFDLFAPQNVKMIPLVDQMILYPGDSIFIDLDFADIGNVHFSGDRAETNRVLQKYLSNNASIVNFWPYTSLEIDDYKLYCDSIRADALEKHERFVSEENPPSDLIQWSSDLIHINYYHSILFYPLQYFGRNEGAYKSWVNSTNYFDFMADIKTDFSHYGNDIVHSDIYNLAGIYYRIIWDKLRNNMPEGEVPKPAEFMDELIKIENGNVFKEILFGITSYQLLLSQEFNKFHNLKEIFDNQINAPFIKLPLTELYNNSMQSRENPKTASDAIFSSMGIEGKELLDSIIAENRGKVLFIDLWATWCTPCIQGMKTAKEIVPKYENDDIEFIYLCISSTEENWQTTQARLQIGGQHYLCNDQQSRDIKAALKVVAIPHYFIINKDGHIVQSKSPGLFGSEDKISELLQQ